MRRPPCRGRSSRRARAAGRMPLPPRKIRPSLATGPGLKEGSDRSGGSARADSCLGGGNFPPDKGKPNNFSTRGSSLWTLTTRIGRGVGCPTAQPGAVNRDPGFIYIYIYI